MGLARRLGFHNASKDAFEAIAPVREGVAFVIGANGAKLLKETAHGSLQEIRPLIRQAVAQTPSNLAQYCSGIGLENNCQHAAEIGDFNCFDKLEPALTTVSSRITRSCGLSSVALPCNLNWDKKSTL